MQIILIIFTVFLFGPEKENEKIYIHLNKAGMEAVEKYKKRFPFREPLFLRVEIVSRRDKRIPEWASGIYFNKTILLKENSIDNLIKTFNHEIAHSFFHNFIEGQRLPLWFEEGLAQVMAGEEEDLLTLFLLNLTGGTEIEKLENTFPSSYLGKRLAYAKSRILVKKMIDKGGWDEFYLFLYNLNKGIDFERAFFSFMGENLLSFEKSFKKDRVFKIMLYLGTGSLLFWFLLSVFLIFAYILKRKKNKNLVKSWEEDDTDLPYF